MIYFDSHIHTYPFSSDSHQTIEDVLNAHKTSNYGFILTEHMDYLYKGNIDFQFNPEEYFAQYAKYRSDRFLLGVEMGLTKENIALVKDTLEKYPFDMVIGSIHTVTEDISYPSFYEGISKNDCYQNYLYAMLNCLKHYTAFDTLGHIDYICRYSTYDDPELHVHEHKELLTEIFRTLINADICLEINTRRLDKPVGIDTLSELLRLYSSLGGRKVTVGSDSHRTDNLACNFDQAEKLISEHRLVPVYFKDRKPVYQS